MLARSAIQPKTPSKSGRPREFSEADAWAPVGAGWQPLYGGFGKTGFSVEWHDFTAERELNWSRSFHPAGLEICFNLAGQGEVEAGGRVLSLTPATAGFYFQNESRLNAFRGGKQRHQFVTIEFSLPFIEAHFERNEPGLHPGICDLLAGGGRRKAAVSKATCLTVGQQETISSLRSPPVSSAGHRLWYGAKALELAAALLYRPSDEEFFCERVNRLNQERAHKVIALLKGNLSEPPTLQEIGKRVGCSHFYLSRIFTQVMGKTISSCLRDLRMERAAELLKEAKLNVTQVALEIGYSSPSHFTVAFREKFGCCPGLYALNRLVRD